MSMNWSYDVQCGNLGKSQALTNEYSTSMYIQCGWLSFVKLTVSAIWIFSRYVETAELHPRLNNTSYIKSQKKVANGSKNPCAQRYRYRDRKIIFFTLHHWQRKYKSQEQKKKLLYDMIEVFLPLVTGKIGSATFSLIARDFIFPLVITFSQNLERTNSFMWGMRAQKPIAFAFVNLRDAPFFLKVLYNL